MYSKIINEAFDAGYVAAWDLWHMTPTEVNGRLKAYTASQQQKMEQLDILAWMVGQYTAQAYHNPKNYPRKPSIIKKPVAKQARLDDDSMKDILTAFAETHNAIEGVKP